MDRKQSQFTQVDALYSSDFIPAFGQATNKKISKADFFKQIKDETQIFIYPTIEQLQTANLVADPDWPIYVRVEETEYRLYKITSLAAGGDDIPLNNGATATFQDEDYVQVEANAATEQEILEGLTNEKIVTPLGASQTILRTFDTPAQAALASLPVGAKYSTKGCLSIGDGGHGDFIASATAPTTEDGYSCFEHANGTFGVLQPVNGEFNLLQFGAAGNGTTDDTAAIRRANAFMKARGGGVLNFLDRPYKVKRTSKSGESGTTPDDYIILVDYSEITFKGVKGKTKIIHDITDTDFTFMRIGVLPIANGVVSLHDVVLKDMEIDGGYDPVEGTEDGGSALIIAYGVKRFKFTGLYLHRGKDYGIGLQNGGHQDGLIEDCVIEDTGADGIDHKNNGDVSEGNVINNVIVRRFGRHESPSAPYAGVDLMYGWQVSNLLVEEFGAFGTAGAALRLKQGESAEPRGRGGNDTNVVNFKAYAKETPNEALLYLDGIRCSARNCNISNVVVEGVVGAGVRFQQRKNRLTNANCKNGGTGYILEDASYTTEADDCTLVNCDAEGNDVGYRIETDGTKLSNCTGESNGHTFSFPSVASNTTITGGASLTPTIGHIQNTGSSTVRVVEVDGFITSNTVESAPFSITSAGTFNVVVPHGLPFDFDERFASVSVRRSSNIANWTVARLVLVSVTSTDATYQITIGTPSGTGGDTATLLCRFEPRYIASSI